MGSHTLAFPWVYPPSYPVPPVPPLPTSMNPTSRPRHGQGAIPGGYASQGMSGAPGLGAPGAVQSRGETGANAPRAAGGVAHTPAAAQDTRPAGVSGPQPGLGESEACAYAGPAAEDTVDASSLAPPETETALPKTYVDPTFAPAYRRIVEGGLTRFAARWMGGAGDTTSTSWAGTETEPAFACPGKIMQARAAHFEKEHDSNSLEGTLVESLVYMRVGMHRPGETLRAQCAADLREAVTKKADPRPKILAVALAQLRHCAAEHLGDSAVHQTILLGWEGRMRRGFAVDAAPNEIDREVDTWPTGGIYAQSVLLEAAKVVKQMRVA